MTWHLSHVHRGVGTGLDVEGSPWCSDSILVGRSQALHLDPCMWQVGVGLPAFGAPGCVGWGAAQMSSKGGTGAQEPQLGAHATEPPTVSHLFPGSGCFRTR